MKILILSGPNLDLLGAREPEVYGRATLETIVNAVRVRAAELGVEVIAEQSNDEGFLVSRVGHAAGQVDGIVINPGGYSHTSVALHDAIRAAGVPVVEVHLSNIHARESFRRHSLTAAACRGVIAGFGGASYLLGLEALVRALRREEGA